MTARRGFFVGAVMDPIYGTVATAVIGGFLIAAFILGPQMTVGSLFESDLTSARMLDALKGERAILAMLRRRQQRYAELRAFASGGALVLTGWILAAVYCLTTHQIPL